MPLSDHVVNQRVGPEGENVSRGSDPRRVQRDMGARRSAAAGARRKATPVDIRWAKDTLQGLRMVADLIGSDDSNSLLSPILSHLPSLPGIPTLKGFLPASPSKEMIITPSTTPEDLESCASWDKHDFGDGNGRVPVLLVSTARHALRVFAALSGSVPDDPHVREIFPAPEEVFSLSEIRCDASTVVSAVEGVDATKPSGGAEEVCASRMLPSRLKGAEGPCVAVITRAIHKRQSSLSLYIIDLGTGHALRRLDLGHGSAASLHVSARAIAVALSLPRPLIHLFSPHDLSVIHEPIDSVSLDRHTTLPVVALSGRLLAYAANLTPLHPGPDGCGSIVTSQSTSTRAHDSSMPVASGNTAPQYSISHGGQTALLTSAVEIGGGVARGVWAGLKMGAQAASKARAGRLARSAPSEVSGALADDEHFESTDSIVSDWTSAEEEGMTGELRETSAQKERGVWVKVVDLFARPAVKPAPKARRSSSTSRQKPTSLDSGPSTGSSLLQTIAHFKLPPSKSPIAHSPQMNPRMNRIGNGSGSEHASRSQEIAHLSFSPDGTRLLVAAADGRSQHVVDIHPAGPSPHEAGGSRKSPRSDPHGEVWHMYELRRGNTSAHVDGVAWSDDGRMVGVATGKGTIHVYPLSPYGGPASAATHATPQSTNQSQMYPLSMVVTPIARLRSPRTASTKPGHSEDHGAKSSFGPGFFVFSDCRKDPLSTTSCLQDLVIYRPTVNYLELARISLRPAKPRVVLEPGARRPSGTSALTEMMRTKAFGDSGTDLDVETGVKARWMLPSAMPEGVVLPEATKEPIAVTTAVASLARAEIQTHSHNLRILPGSIFLSRQVDFFAARPIDEFSPLTILDLEARMRRLVFRSEVEARPTSPEVKSFDEPLMSALHSVLESPPDQQVIPGLPNGYPGARSWATSIPIRQVAAGAVGLSDRVRREYQRTQQMKLLRQSEAAERSLSFEDDVVFALSTGAKDGPGHIGDEESSGRSSDVLPESDGVDERDAREIGDMDESWGDRWEEEYRRAVEDDGGPEELVLGLMDEEEEERKQYLTKQKNQQKQWK